MLRRQALYILLSLCAALFIACDRNVLSPHARGSIPIGIALAQTSNIALLGQESVAGAKIIDGNGTNGRFNFLK
jgi:branched-chain amino acid transport system substrate-binding protein